MKKAALFITAIFLVTITSVWAAKKSTWTEKTISKTFKASEIKNINVQNESGEVEIKGTSSPEVKVEATIKAKGPSAAEALKRTQIKIYAKKGTLFVKTHTWKGTILSKNKVKVNIKISAPEKLYKLAAVNAAGTINVQNTACKEYELNVNAGTLNLDIPQKNIPSNISLQINAGKINMSSPCLKDIDVNTEINAGTASLNVCGKNFTLNTLNSNLNKTFGKGTTKLTAKADAGTITINMNK